MPAPPVRRHPADHVDPQPVYGSHFSDIHCGMRGITREALSGWGSSPSPGSTPRRWCSSRFEWSCRTAEVPVTFFKDRDGPVSHHKRSGWLSPFQAAWINLRAMFVYGADFFVMKPGLVLLTLDLITLPLSFGTISVGPVTFSLYWMLLA